MRLFCCPSADYCFTRAVGGAKGALLRLSVRHEWLSGASFRREDLREARVGLEDEASAPHRKCAREGWISLFTAFCVCHRVADPRQFGFDGVLFLSQRTSSFPYTSTISTQLDVFPIIAKLYSKETRLPPSFFLPNSVGGKCKSCGGRRELLSDSGDIIGMCPACSGKGYEGKVLQASVSGVLFEELLKAPLSSIGRMLKQQELSRISKFCDLLGIGHLTLSRRTNSLSRGEIQRLQIANSLTQETHNTLFLLDEPSKGLHLSDANNLVAAIRLLLNAGILLLL